jgi:hypothetical protein
VTDRRNGESPVDWSPDPFPSTNHDSRDGITQNIQSHRPNRSTLDRSLSNAIVRSRARARVVASVVARDDATEETMGGYDIPKAFSFVVTARARRSHRPASSIARPPRAAIVSPSRALARSRRPSRDVSRGARRPPSIDEKKHCTYLDLGRLEGGDAADEGGSEESGHCSRVQEWRPKRARGRGRVGAGPTDRVSDRPRVRPTACPTDRPR